MDNTNLTNKNSIKIEEEKLQSSQNFEKEVILLRDKYDAEIKYYKSLLVQKDKLHSAQLAMLEKSYRESWTWRIGNLFVGAVVKCINLVKNPVRFITDNNYRRSWNRYKPGQRAKYTKSYSTATGAGIVESTVETAEYLQLPPVQRIDDKPVIAAVMDEFTTACFRPECTLVTFRPDNWQEKLQKQVPEAVFVESAWGGNQGSWQYKIAKYQRNMGDELNDLLNWAKEHEIPSIFWNKEDPPNFDRFIDKAKLFDFIFTSDEDCIPKYKSHIAHNHIYSLPFAAQPAIHNPLGDAPRSDNVCFAGTYHADEYLDRQNDMEIILNPARDYDLHIYDRNFGSVGPGSERFRFPDKYQEFIKGRLNYDEMVKAYHQFKVFLNVNSVKDSPTMFSRRVFELLATGTPVISTYSRGIVELLGDTVFITESESETRKHLDLLLNDRDAWMRASVRGIRKVMESHTYDRRLQRVMELAGIDYKPSEWPVIGLVIKIRKDEDFSELAENILKQTLQPGHIILLSATAPDPEQIGMLANSNETVKVTVFEESDNNLPGLIQGSAPASYYAFWNPADFYGPDYLKDMAIATKYSGAAIFGKGNYYSYRDGKITEGIADLSYCRVSRAPISTLMVKNELLAQALSWLNANRDGMFTSDLQDIISTDPLNFIKNDGNLPHLDESIAQRCFA